MANRTMDKKLHGIYHAHSGIFGKLGYTFGKIAQTKHCYLCDITHSLAWKKSAWIELTQRLDIPIELLHVNEQHEEMRNFTRGRTPCVILESEHGYREVLGSDALRACNGDVQKFEEMLLRSHL